MTRLAQQWPECAERLAALDIDRQRQIAIRAALAGLDALGYPIPEGDELTVEAEVERLDGLAWEIQEDWAAQPEDYELAFRRARAVNAYFLAKYRGSAADALYEALHALGAQSDPTMVFDL